VDGLPRTAFHALVILLVVVFIVIVTIVVLALFCVIALFCVLACTYYMLTLLVTYRGVI